MTANAKQQRITPTSGFAIVVVLASLLILTTLFAIASQRSLTHLQSQNAERRLSDTQTGNAAILTILRDLGPQPTGSGNIPLPPPFSDMQLRMQDVGGLIDLNTASPALLDALFSALDFPPDAADLFRQWRREGRRLARLDDLIRITGADPAHLAELTHVATVFSGRRGIAVELAPEDVRVIATTGGTIPEAYTSPPSNTNFAIYGNGLLIGTISLQGINGQSRVLELR